MRSSLKITPMNPIGWMQTHMMIGGSKALWIWPHRSLKVLKLFFICCILTIKKKIQVQCPYFNNIEAQMFQKFQKFKIKSFAKNYKKVVNFNLKAQIEGGQLYNVFLYFPYFLSYEQKMYFCLKKNYAFLTKYKNIWK